MKICRVELLIYRIIYCLWKLNLYKKNEIGSWWASDFVKSLRIQA